MPLKSYYDLEPQTIFFHFRQKIHNEANQVFIVSIFFCNMQIICWPNGNQLWPTRWQCQRPRTEVNPVRIWISGTRKKSSREQYVWRPPCTCKDVPARPVSWPVGRICVWHTVDSCGPLPDATGWWLLLRIRLKLWLRWCVAIVRIWRLLY